MKKQLAVILSILTLVSTLTGCAPSESSVPSSKVENSSTTNIEQFTSSTSVVESEISSNSENSSETSEATYTSSTSPAVSSTPVVSSASTSSTAPTVTTTKAVSRMKFNDELITDIAKRDLVQNNDDILDVAFVVDEMNHEIQIAIQVPMSTNLETVKEMGDRAARYLASLANFANSEYELPGNDDLGGLFEKYDLLLYIDDGYGNIDKYGAKVTFSPVITW